MPKQMPSKNYEKHSAIEVVKIERSKSVDRLAKPQQLEEDFFKGIGQNHQKDFYLN